MALTDQDICPFNNKFCVATCLYRMDDGCAASNDTILTVEKLEEAQKALEDWEAVPNYINIVPHFDLINEFTNKYIGPKKPKMREEIIYDDD